MPTIAQKLCRDIVDPISNTIRKTSTKSLNRLSNQNSPDNTTKLAVINKNRIITNVRPLPVNPNGMKICDKSRDTLLKAKKSPSHKPVNTFISGPPKCDNNCITLVRKRENTCKCARTKLSNVSAKQIQTSAAVNHLKTDNAYSQCTETASSAIKLLKGSSFFKNKPRNKLCVSTETRSMTSQSIVRPYVSVKSKPVSKTPTVISKKRECPFKPESVNEKIRNCSKKRECPFKSELTYEEASNHADKTKLYLRPELKNDKSTNCSEEREYLFRPKTIYEISRYPEKREYSFTVENFNKKLRYNLEKREFPFRCLNKPWAISNYPKRGPDF